jgi:phosphoribosyl 1,2-cyclic phosphodiesterase
LTNDSYIVIIIVMITKDNYNIKIKFWGTRGSIPTPGRYFIKYGGNTSCVEIRCGDTIIICDAGSGLRELGASLIHEFGADPQQFHILISHTHWDHIQGFPFFSMAYLPGNEIIFYGGNSVSNLENLLYSQMDRDFFPVTLNELSSDISFKHLIDNPFNINDVKIFYTHQIHPSLSIGYRIEYRDKVVVYATDSEISDDPEIEKINEKNIGNLIKDADVLIADCQYTLDEYKSKEGWGHSSIDKMIDISNKNGVKNLFAFHHDPVRSDEQMDLMLDNAQKLVKKPLNLYGAKEKTTILL